MTRRRSRLVPAALLLLGGALPALATTIVPIADGDLVDRSPAVALVSVEAKLPTLLERPVTDWLVVVERVMKGRIAASRIVVRVPGGLSANGRRLFLFGTPPLAPGRRAILFLTPGGAGNWRLVGFPQGAFVSVRTAAGELALRDLEGVQVLSRGVEGSWKRLRETERFADWIEDRARGLHRRADYFVPENATALEVPAFRLFEESGLNLRWFNFDSGSVVTFRSHEAGQPGLLGGGGAEVQRALAAWTDEPTTPIRLVYGGTSGLTGGFKTPDNFNVVLWNDPNGEVEGTFSCSSGGTIAIGGPWHSGTGTFDGKRYRRIVAGDVVFNNGVDCVASTPLSFSKFIEQVAAHEIGHTLGLHHSSENENEPSAALRDALMYFRAHRDDRGARLAADDIAGAQALYRAGGGGGGGTAKGCPPGTPAGTLCLLNGRFRVTATWQNQFDGTSGAAGAVPSTDFAGFLYFASPENLELAVKILDFGSEIKVFYSQLTNLRFTLTVTDSSSGRVKTYSNTAGDCGAIDDNFLTGAASSSAADTTAPAGVVAGKCVADATTLCLLNGRFAISVDWRNQFDGSSGTGKPKPLSALTGAFAFADPANLELLIKTLDFGDRRLVLYGSLSNLEYTLRVTDASTGETKSYFNPAGQFCGGLDEDF